MPDIFIRILFILKRKYKRTEVLAFLCNRKRKNTCVNGPSSKKIRLTKLAEEFEKLETLEHELEAKKLSLKLKHNKATNDLAKEFNERSEELRKLIRKDEENLAKENQTNTSQKQSLQHEIQTHVTSRTPASVPECPICLESLYPPTRLYNCPEGHVVCWECRPKVTICSLCREPFQGRATAMEQYLRAQFGVQ